MDDVDNNNYAIHREDYSVSIVYLCVSGVFVGGGGEEDAIIVDIMYYKLEWLSMLLGHSLTLS